MTRREQRLEDLKTTVAAAVKGKGFTAEQVRALYWWNAKLINEEEDAK